MEERKHIVILAAGDFPTHEVPLRSLDEADFVVCCDSAYKNWVADRPFVVVGDGDSLTPDVRSVLGDKYLQVVEQDYNDLHKAMDYATAKFSIPNTQYTILGATGRREDHTMGNISYLTTFIKEHPGIQVEMLTDYGRFTAFQGCRKYSSFPRQQVSIFTLTPDVPVTASGLRWPLQGDCLTVWWQGTLNEALGDTFTVEGGTMVIFQTYSAKE